MGKTTGYYRPGQAGGYADPYPTGGGRRRQSFLNNAGSARARLMEEQLKMAQLQRKMMMEEFMNSRRRKVESPSVLSSDRGSQAAADRERYKRATMMATSIRDKAGPGGMGYGTDSFRNLVNMIYAIGPDAAQQGMMQSGRLFSSGGRGATTTRHADIGAPKPSPYTQISNPMADPGATTGKYIRPGRQGSSSFVGPLQGLEKGTLPGTVPETGKTMVHEGEIVIPKRQADTPLMKYLIEDARRKQIPLGHESPRGYQEGSLGEDERFLAEWEKRIQDSDDFDFLSWWEEELKKSKPPKEKKPSPKYELPKDISALTKSDVREDRGLTWPQSIGRGAKVVGGAIGDVAGTVGEAATELGRGLVEGYTGEDYLAGVAEQVPGVVAQNKAMLAETNAARAAVPRGEAADGPPPIEDPTGFKLAQERVRGGDFGTPDKPLELTGQLSPREKAYREISSTPEQREARNKAQMARAEVTKLLTQLQYHGHQLDPEVKKNLLEQVKFHATIAKGWEGEIREREKAVEEELKISESSAASLNKSMALEYQRQQGKIDVEEKREDRQAAILNQRQIGNNLRDAYKGFAGAGTQAERQRWQNVLATLITQAVKRANQRTLTEEEASDAAIAFSGMSAQQMEDAIIALSEQE